MKTDPLGEWHWYSGSHETDDEMCECATRAAAIQNGLRDFAPDKFYIVEARMKRADEDRLGHEIDSAPFAETRDGEWIDPELHEVPT